ncbi:MAG: tetratricopeptide repeat protein [Thermoanaerobaculia bacterium]|nr:tetratricopeptide repeat protein [Thermoanaerobaculia bacterium]
MRIHRNILFCYLFLLCGQLYAQQTSNVPAPAAQGQKGVTPLTPPSGGGGAVRAVVIGISDYQDPAIPDLRFARKDAEAFADFLSKGPGMGSQLDADHLKTLYDREATTAQVAAALDWLIDVSREGDLCIIYFSGHGDVETKTRNQLGFLLTWDSPPRSYIAGAYPLFYLQEVISTLSILNKSRVLVITDACRAGKLAGSGIGGAQATAANLSKQFANEIKLLSCQPNEYSLEGEQWGGGRGAFSYHLIDGLYGLADHNKDLSVNLLEIERYLQDHVTSEVAPQSQMPMAVGNKSEKLAAVSPELLAAVQNNRSKQAPIIASTDARGVEDQVLARTDQATRDRYFAFQQALKDRVFFDPPESGADTLYRQLMRAPGLEPLHAAMRRNYAAALQDESQQALNAWLQTDIREITLSRLNRFKKYQHYARYLERAAELLGPDHYMYRGLQARKSLYEGFMARLENLWGTDRELSMAVLEKYRNSLRWQPDVPHTYLFMANNFGWNLGQPDSAYHYAMKAAAAAPQWVLPYTNTAYLLIMRYKQFDRAKQLLDKALANDSSSAVVWNYFGVWHYKQKQYAEAEQAYRHALRIDSAFTYAWFNLGLTCMDMHRDTEAEQVFQHALALDSTNVDANNNLGWLYVSTRRWAEAESLLLRATALDPSYPFAWNNLGAVYLNTGRLDEAEAMIRKSIAIDSSNAWAWNNLGQVCRRTQRESDAADCFLRAVAKAPAFAEPYFHLACLEAARGNTGPAWTYLRQALENGYRDYEALTREPGLANLRSRGLGTEWGELMKRYFPER